MIRPNAMSIREQIEEGERRALSSRAQLSAASRGRERPEEEDDLRTCYQRDRDRILHCKAFRRLAFKTQVFLAPEGDHYRTRITHTLEVAQIGRTLARCLRLNEQLTEAIVYGHDLGHTPFGHAGEAVLARLLPVGFHHVRQSLRVVDQLERDGAGLNLTLEVRDGILKHSKGKGAILDKDEGTALTLEGQIVRLADIIAYVNHDLDDAIRAQVLCPEDVPADLRRLLGDRPSQRIRRLIVAVIDATRRIDEARIEMEEEAHAALVRLRDFLYERVYDSPLVHGEFEKVEHILADLWQHWHQHEDEFRERHWLKGTRPDEGIDRAVADFIAGMTDRYALRLYEELRLPKRWSIY